MKDITCYANIGIFADVDVGKTTTNERIMKFTGKINKIDQLHQGAAINNYKNN